MSTNKQVMNPLVSVVELKNPISTTHGTARFKVTAFDGKAIPSGREIFWDSTNFFYRTSPHVKASRYCITWDKNQLVTVDKVTYVLGRNVRVEAVAEGIVSPCRANLPAIVTNRDYRLANNVKVSIIAKVHTPGIANEMQNVGVYLAGNDLAAIRFDTKGKVLSHGGDRMFNIVELWTETTVWLVLYRDNGRVATSRPFDFEHDAKTFAKTVSALKIVKETV